METFLIIMLILPVVLFFLPGTQDILSEIPRLIIWYAVFGLPYVIYYL
tara:strand:- start:511 stop:654 length:144 start_codon:yes stop_codon:yes gene_type:complete